MPRRTRIVATLGPATADPAALDGVVAAGVDVVRLNLAHGALADHLATVARVRSAATAAGRTVGVLADLPGPKARTGELAAGGVQLDEGTAVALVAEGAPAAGVLAVGAPLLGALQPGDLVILGDGAVTLVVDEVDRTGGAATATVVTGGRLQGRPGIATRPERLTQGAPTADDLRLLDAVAGAVDLVAVSFVRSAADVRAVRAAAGPEGPAVVAKIETAEAVADLDAVVPAADAVMVARGDLGIRVPLEDVPFLQRRIVRACVAAARPVIIATQLLESMVRAPTPTRAEVADVAAAVEDGSDALMLSAETAIGRDPVAVVRTMARIAERAEAELDPTAWGRHLAPGGPSPVTDAITAAAWRAAHDARAAAIVCWTRSGATARAMARLRPAAPLVGLTPSDVTARRMALTWGVLPVVDRSHPEPAALAETAVRHALRLGVAAAGDVLAVLASSSAVPGADTDLLRLVTVP